MWRSWKNRNGLGTDKGEGSRGWPVVRVTTIRRFEMSMSCEIVGLSRAQGKPQASALGLVVVFESLKVSREQVPLVGVGERVVDSFASGCEWVLWRRWKAFLVHRESEDRPGGEARGQ